MYYIKSFFKLKTIMLAFMGFSSLWLFGCISNDNYGNNNVVVEDARMGSHRSKAGTVTRVSSTNTAKRQTVVQRNVTVQERNFQEQPLGSNVAPAGGTDYRVVSGDTLFSIAFRYGKSYQALAQENNIAPPYNIKVGDIIHISGNTSEQDVASASAGGIYTVKKGDTLTSVAREHGLPPSAIVRVNNLSYPYKLVPGQRLTLEDPDAKRQVEKSEQKFVPVAGVNESTQSTATENSASSATTQIVSGRTRTAGGVVWMWPASGKVVKGFSLNENGNKGIDIAGTRGQNVMSAADGQVVYSGSALRGYGKLIIVNHDNEYLSAYAHNDKLLVKEGQKVKRGQVIANMGSTDASRVQLHFEIRYKGKSVNPLGYLPK